jgi:hypothetical protein
MNRTLRRSPLCRPWAVWLAVLIAVLGALAPTLTHALMPAIGQASQAQEICTSQGSRWVTADAAAGSDDSTPLPASVAPSAHCQFCLQTTDRVASLDDPLPTPFLVQDGQRESPVWQAFFYAKTHTFAPPPRGPPGFF